MKNKLILGTGIVFLLVLTVIFPGGLSIEGNSADYNVRISLGSISSNTSTEDGTFRIHSDQFSANLTSDTLGTLSIFGMELPPSQPQLSNPLNASATNETFIEFSWVNSTDPNRETDFGTITYLFELFNDSSFTQEYYRNSTIAEETDTRINITVPEEIALYWRVLATDGQQNSSFSEARITTTDRTVPTAFNLLTPSNATTTTDNTPSLSWETSTEANIKNYTIEFSTSELYVNPNYTQHSTTNSFSNWTIQLDAGTYYWKVIVYDQVENKNESLQQFTLTISPITETTTVSVSTGEAVTRSGGVKQKPFNLDIIAPPTVTIYSEDSVIVPLIVTNPANEIILRGINLNVTSDSADVAPALGTTYIPELRPKEQRQVPLTIVTHTNPGTYGITITAEVVNPQFSDSVKILANLIESDEQATKIQSEKQLIFAQNLFDGNPGCIELKEYLTQAQEEFAAGRYNKALNLANNAINSCKDLIAFIEEPKPQNVQTYLEKFKLNRTVLILIGESFAFLLTLFIAIKVIRRKK